MINDIVKAPTYWGDAPGHEQYEDNGHTVKVSSEEGVMLTPDPNRKNKGPDILLERRPRGWMLSILYAKGCQVLIAMPDPSSRSDRRIAIHSFVDGIHCGTGSTRDGEFPITIMRPAPGQSFGEMAGVDEPSMPDIPPADCKNIVDRLMMAHPGIHLQGMETSGADVLQDLCEMVSKHLKPTP